VFVRERETERVGVEGKRKKNLTFESILVKKLEARSHVFLFFASVEHGLDEGNSVGSERGLVGDSIRDIVTEGDLFFVRAKKIK